MTNLQIEYFLHVATTKSITKSAVDLYVSAPAISKQITLLEQELDLSLFVRGARGMDLTPAGQVMFDHYMSRKDELDRALMRARNLSSNRLNTLHLGIMAGWGIHRPIARLQKLMMNSPVPTAVIPHAVFDPGDPQRLEKFAFDAALCIGDDLFTTALSTSVHMTPLLKIRKEFLFSSQLPLAQKPDLAPIDFSDLPLLSFTSEVRSNAQYDNLRLCSKLDFNPKLVLKDSLDDAFFCAALGEGFLIGDEWLCHKNLPEFSSIPISDFHTIYLVWSEHNQNPALPILERICENDMDWSL